MAMINLFTPATQDKSLEYLYRLFGDMNGLLGGGAVSAPALFGELFRVFNSIALVIGTLIVVYATIVGVLKTAAEGEFLGKQWNSLWVPLRMVLGIAALFPTPTGYSGLQMIMMWVILQGVGAADQVWNRALRFVTVMGSPYTQNVQIPTAGVKVGMAQLFAVLTCDQSMNQGGKPAPYKRDLQEGGSQDYGQYNSPFNSSNISEGTGAWTPGSAKSYSTRCGSFIIEQGGSCPMSTGADDNDISKMAPILQCRVANAQVKAMKSITEVLSGYAKKVVSIDRTYQEFYKAVQLSYSFGSLVPGTTLRNPKSPQYQQALTLFRSNQFLQTACDKVLAVGGLTKLPNQSRDDLCISLPMITLLGVPSSVAFVTGSPAYTSVFSVYYPALLEQGLRSDFIDASTNEYARRVAQPINDYLSHLIQSDKTALPAELQQAQNTGWLFAGAYYYILSQSNNKALQLAGTVRFDVLPTNLAQDPVTKNKYTNMETAAYIIQAAAAQQGFGGMSSVGMAFAGAGGEAGPVGAQAVGMAGDASSYTFDGWGNMMKQKNTDPVVALAGWGYTLLFLVPILWAGLLVLFVLISFAVSLAPSVLGTGVGAPASGPYWTAIALLFPLFFTLFSLLIGVGGLLGVYTPFVPYVIFLVGGLGWLISIVETMVAGPLVALGILAPGGHHDVLGKAEPALMLLFGNFLRPTLMIFGMFAAMLLAPIALDLVNGTFDTIRISVLSSGSSWGASTSNKGAQANIVAMFFMLCVYVMLILTLLNKCFAAIHVIPERVMAWISGQGAQYGEAESLGEARKGAEGAAGGMTQSMGESKGAAKGGADSAGSTEKGRRDQEDRDKKKKEESLKPRE